MLRLLTKRWIIKCLNLVFKSYITFGMALNLHIHHQWCLNLKIDFQTVVYRWNNYIASLESICTIRTSASMHRHHVSVLHLLPDVWALSLHIIIFSLSHSFHLLSNLHHISSFSTSYPFFNLDLFKVQQSHTASTVLNTLTSVHKQICRAGAVDQWFLVNCWNNQKYRSSWYFR